MAVSFKVAEDFERARRKGTWQRLVARLLRRNSALLPFEETRLRLAAQGQHYGGFRTVPITQIVGSVNRYHDFDRAFLPRHKATRHRWQSIDRAYYEDNSLPPIELYQLGQTYFVKDGNHRVSVAREQGQDFIDAYVVELDVPVRIGSLDELETWVRHEDAPDFATRTKLVALRPEAQIELTLCGQYEKLLEHIGVHRWFLGTQRGECVSWDEAVGSWFDEVYTPLVETVRESNVLADFPRRTEADLYLWLIEHRWFLEQSGALDADAPFEDVVREYAAAYSPRLWRRLARLIS
jgi:hypothetical protein